ncbi:MAG: phytanoyl-CoA dioxygenase family protein [Proteobacteria bacterium]|nr:phytanoyl-CoA dioxygenase family protein [Pseudomonadota bacterium]
MPVAERTEAPGYSGWWEKDGSLFVQPPLEVLEQSVAARVHLDGSDEETGALKVVPRSHTLGRLRPQKAFTARGIHGERLVPVPRGGLMLMRPLLLHASSKVTGNARRRVLHFLFGPSHLPGGVQWPQLAASPRSQATPISL